MNKTQLHLAFGNMADFPLPPCLHPNTLQSGPFLHFKGVGQGSNGKEII